MELVFEESRIDEGEGRDLVEALVAYLVGLYPDYDADDRGGAQATQEDFTEPAGAFWVGRDLGDGKAVCCGGFKYSAPGVAEVKRMFVVPDKRRRLGVGRLLLAHLEDRARERGYTTVRLNTGPEQGRAIGLYRSSGYREIPRYNDHQLATWFGEKALVPPT